MHCRFHSISFRPLLGTWAALAALPWQAAAFGILLVAACIGARADVLVLTNGDRISGEVQKLSQRKLAVKTAYAGTIQIDWSQVERFSTEKKFEVEVETGRRYRGVLERDEGGLAVVGNEGAESIAPIAVVSLIPMSDGRPPGFWQTLDGSLDVGYSFTRGNSQSNQSSLGVRGKYRREKYQLQGSAASLFSKVDDAEPASRQTADLRYDRFLGPEAFSFGLAGLERNDRQGLNLRSRLGGGFGWNVAHTRETQFSLLGGFTYINEQFRDMDSGTELPRTSSGEALAGIELEALRFNQVKLTTKLSVHPNLVDTGRYRVEYDTSVRMPVFRNITWSVSLFDRFDSDPPLAVERNDYGLVSAFGISF